MSLDENKAIALRYFDTWHTGDMEEAAALLAAGFVDHNPTPGFVPDKAGTLAFMRHFRGAFPDLRFTLEDILAEGDRVMDRWTMQATHLGEFLGIAATGRQVSLQGIDILRVVEGQIVESWHMENQLDALQQVGVLPMLEGGQGKQPS
jgi:steroid delta-isomerase-like uncharacterized protein